MAFVLHGGLRNLRGHAAALSLARGITPICRIGNTKIAAMLAFHLASSRKRRSAAPGVTGGDGALIDISLQKTVKNSHESRGTEPDLDLIKQVEQVTTSDLEGPA